MNNERRKPKTYIKLKSQNNISNVYVVAKTFKKVKKGRTTNKKDGKSCAIRIKRKENIW